MMASGGPISAIGPSGCAIPLKCTQNGHLYVENAGGAAQVQNASIETSSIAAPQNGGCACGDGLARPVLAHPTYLPDGGAQTLAGQFSVEPQQVFAGTVQLHTVELTNLTDHQIIVRLLDCELGGFGKFDAVAASKGASLKRKLWARRSAKVTPDIAAAVVADSTADAEIAALSGDAKASKLSWWLNPGEYRMISYPAGAAFDHGIAMNVRVSADTPIEPGAKMCHAQMTCTHS